MQLTFNAAFILLLHSGRNVLSLFSVGICVNINVRGWCSNAGDRGAADTLAQTQLTTSSPSILVMWTLLLACGTV